MQRFSDVYFDSDIDDDKVIGCILNTVLNDESDPSIIGLNLLKHGHVMMIHEVQNIVNRPKCKKIIDTLNEICMLTPKSKEKLECMVKHIKENYGNYDDGYCIYISCFCRATWEIEYQDMIAYKQPYYATMEAMGEPPYSVFYESLENNDYVLM